MPLDCYVRSVGQFPLRYGTVEAYKSLQGKSLRFFLNGYAFLVTFVDVQIVTIFSPKTHIK